jgi:hypothetical protein
MTLLDDSAFLCGTMIQNARPEITGAMTNWATGDRKRLGGKSAQNPSLSCTLSTPLPLHTNNHPLCVQHHSSYSAFVKSFLLFGFTLFSSVV